MTESATQIRLFRVASTAERDDLLAVGKFRAAPNSLLGKWFADDLTGAVKRLSQLYPVGDGHIVVATISQDIYDLCWHDDKLDLAGPATYVEAEYLDKLVFLPEE